jgi:type I restriction enzyme S subunit
MDAIAKIPMYETYKDSGVEWLGEIPAHWPSERAKWLFKRAERPIQDSDEIVTCFRDGTVTLRKNRRLDGFTNAMKEHGYQGIRKGDLVIHAMDAFAGAIGVSDSDGKSTPVYAACVPRIENSVNPCFYAYFIRDMALSGFITSLAKGIRERSTDFRFADFAELELPFPSLEEQTLIANFLDQKTAQIDEAIAIKEQQIALLKERKQIIIQKAVTQGLDPDVTMKDSGVDWIGKIPAHWEVKKLRYLGETQNGISAGAEYFGEGFPFVSYGDVYKNRMLPASVEGLAKSTLNDQKLYSVNTGDVFFTRTSETVDEIGFASICFKTIENATFAGFLIRFRPSSDELTKEFSRFYFNSDLMRKYFVREMNLVIRASLSQELLKDLPVILPSPEEQLKIYECLEKIGAKVDSSVSVQLNQIAKLKEYKTTLINSAVTGKIRITPEMVA